MNKLVLSFALVIASISTHAQSIFEYGTHAVSTAEFLEVFRKNNPNKKFEAAQINEYIDLYALFKMKIREAELMKIDTIESVQQEIKSYQQQLAKSYLIDNNLKDKLLDEAYARSKEEIEVSHILISSRSAVDTMNAYRKIQDIYSQLKANPSSFEKLAIEKSEDKGTGKNGGKIGYITSLNVVYPFEQVAYNTPVGNISAPFKTIYGYHILKVTDRRPNKGKVTVQHILQTPLNRKDSTELKKSLDEITSIRAALVAGADFDSMASVASQDKFSKASGGLLAPFGAGQMAAPFEQAAFALQQVGDLSQPVLTDYGYHIIKLVKGRALPTYDEIRDELNKKIEKDGRMSIAQKAAEEQQLKEINFYEHIEALTPIIDLIKNDTALAAKLDREQLATMHKPLFGIQKEHYSQQDFITYLLDATDGTIYGNKAQSIQDLYYNYKDQKIKEWQLSNLEATNPAFKKLMNEYREGILLFEIMDRTVWSRGIKDKEGLLEYYEEHKQKYLYDEGFDGYLFESSSQIVLDELRTQIAQGEDIMHSINQINNYHESGAQITVKEGVQEYGNIELVNQRIPINVMSPITKNSKGIFVAYYVKNNVPQGTVKPMEAVKGPLVSDYQAHLEKSWHTELRKKYPLKVNQKQVQKVLNTKI